MSFGVCNVLEILLLLMQLAAVCGQLESGFPEYRQSIVRGATVPRHQINNFIRNARNNGNSDTNRFQAVNRSPGRRFSDFPQASNSARRTGDVVGRNVFRSFTNNSGHTGDRTINIRQHQSRLSSIRSNVHHRGSLNRSGGSKRARYPEHVLSPSSGRQAENIKYNINNSGNVQRNAPRRQVQTVTQRLTQNTARRTQGQLPTQGRFSPRSLQQDLTLNRGQNFVGQLRRSELSFGQFIPSFAGRATQRFPDENTVLANIYNGESNEAFQYGTAVHGTPVGLGFKQNRQQFTGVPVESLQLPFEPLSRHYEKFKKSQSSGKTQNNHGISRYSVSRRPMITDERVLHQTEIIPLPQRSRTGHREETLHRVRPPFETAIRPVSLQQLLGLSPEAIRDAAKDYSTTQPIPQKADTSKNPPNNAVSSSQSRMNTGNSRVFADMVNSGRDVNYNTVKEGRPSESSSHKQNPTTTNPPKTRQQLANEIGRIIELVQLYHMLSGNEAGENIIPGAELGDGFVD